MKTPASTGFQLLLKGIAVALSLAALSLLFLPDRHLIRRTLIDDSYYCFSIAYNIGMGNGITIDGHTWTNGFHPLFVFLMAPMFWLVHGDKYLAIRFIFFLHWFFYIGTAFLLGLIARNALSGIQELPRQFVFWCTYVLYLSAPDILDKHFNGLETGCLLFFYALVWWYYQKADLERWSNLAVLGALLGAAVLSRIDAAFLAVIISCCRFFSGKDTPLRVRFGRFLIIGGVAFLVSSPWWFYNLFGFGNLQPTSGQAQTLWLVDPLRIKIALHSIISDLMPFIYLKLPAVLNFFPGVVRVAVVVLRLLCIAGVVGVLLTEGRRLSRAFSFDKHINQTMEFGICLFLSGLILAAWYTFSSWAAFFYNRYFSPLFLVSALFTAFLMQYLLRRFPRGIALFFICAALFMLTKITLFYAGHPRFSGNSDLFQKLELVMEKVPSQEYVATVSSGTLGYFRDHTVNLDGKVNISALKSQNHMPEYLRKNKITWFCDIMVFVQKCLGNDPERYGWRLVEKRGTFLLYHYEGGM